MTERNLLITYIALGIALCMGIVILISCNTQCRLDRYATIYSLCLDEGTLSTEDCNQFAIVGAWDE